MEMIKWYKYVVLQNYANFNGRASRSEFWWFVLANFIISIILGYVDRSIGTQFISTLYGLAVLIPGIAVSVRRLHDIGKSGWNLLWGLIPIIGAIILIIWYVKESYPEENQYGQVPSTIPTE